MTLTDIPCEYCQKTFTQKKYWQRFCSSKCKNAFRWATHEIVPINPLGTSVPNLAESGSPDIDNPPKQNN